MNSIPSALPFGTRTLRLPRGRLAFLAIVLLMPIMSQAAGASEGEKKQEPSKDEKWRSLFDGRSLGKWKVIDKFDYSRHGKVHVRDGHIQIEKGNPATGIRWTGKFPKIDYEVSFEAMRVEGEDFFCGLTFPVAKSALTLVLGGWGGSVVGLSSIDGEPAVENETCLYMDFEQKRWYRVRLRVTGPRIEVWIDKKKVIELATKDRKFTLYWEMEPALPFGIATWHTTGAVRDIRVRPIKPPPAGS